MARTQEMRLIELMTLKQDVSNVVEYLGKKGVFQFQSKKHDSSSEKSEKPINPDGEFYESLQKARIFLNVEDRPEGDLDCPCATDDDRDSAARIISSVNELAKKVNEQSETTKRAIESYKEALAFSNLQVPYAELEHFSFLSLKIGRIPAGSVDDLRASVGKHAQIIPLGEDESRIMAVSSKKGRFALDTELKAHGFVAMEIPKDFKGIPEDLLSSLKMQKEEAEKKLSYLETEKNNFAQTHKDELLRLLQAFCMSMQITQIQEKLESTSLVYRITGWIPAVECRNFMKELDQLTQGRIAIREYLPSEVPSVLNGEEKVPVKLKHGSFIRSFERLIFSYGSPVYGTIDPTPFVAVFFTILFGFMFGDLGQGLVFLLIGILMSKNIIKVKGWNKFSPIFMAIGITSSIMGLLTGEFFSNETLLAPFAEVVTGLFGSPRHPIVHMMPSSDPHSIVVMFTVFGIAVGIGFVINTIGLILNIANKFMQKKWGSAIFGKTGLAGALFFWYVVFFGISVAAFGHSPEVYDWVIIGTTLFFAAFGEPFERLVDGERPVVENGFGALVIGGVVELIEVISSYMSNTVSFLRVGAFALSHAVLGYIINTMTALVGGAGGILILIAGNLIVIVLEGMIVAIQVVRLQYYEFFSKFFNETGAEFQPLKFHYGNK